MDQVLAIAARLSEAASVPAPQEATRLSGGKNNRVFAVKDVAGQRRVMKLYHVSASDQRDRLGAEWRFLTYAGARGIMNVPTPLAMDRTESAALYSFRAGVKLAPGEVRTVHVQAALDFIIALNRAPRDVAGIAAGSEACFTIGDHVATVARRVSRLANLDERAPHAAEARAFVEGRLNPSWAQLQRRIEAESAEHVSRPLAAGARIVSPSDFGFHNALADEGAVSFIDFEYAGMDDPAKLVGDLFSVPEIPTPLTDLDLFIDGLAQGLDLGSSFPRRARLLLDAYRIKWACIILNDFLPQGEARRAYALEGDRAERCAQQLAKARHLLAVVQSQPGQN